MSEDWKYDETTISDSTINVFDRCTFNVFNSEPVLDGYHPPFKISVFKSYRDYGDYLMVRLELMGSDDLIRYIIPACKMKNNTSSTVSGSLRFLSEYALGLLSMEKKLKLLSMTYKAGKRAGNHELKKRFQELMT